jgi:hypothetical protein
MVAHPVSFPLRFFLLQPMPDQSDITKQGNHQRDPRIMLQGALLRHQSRPLQAPAKDERLFHGRLRLILRLGFTRILPKAFTNVQFAPMKLAGILKCGHVAHVGPCSISVVSKSGPRTKDPQLRKVRLKMDNYHLRSSGDALAVTCHKRRCPLPTAAGARRSLTRKLYPVCLHTRAGKPAADRRLSPSRALIRAI